VESSEFKDVLRERIEGLIRARLAEVEAAVSTARSEVSDLMGRLTHVVSPSSVNYAENPILDQLSREIHAQVGQAAAESSRLSGDLALLRDSVVDVDSQQTQADVLNVLVDRAASFAPRVILFVVKGQDAIAWAARGFEDEIGDGAVRGLSVTLASDTVLHSVVRNGSTFLGVPQDQPDNAVLLDRLGSVMPERIAGIPLRVRAKIAAVLYADTYDTSVSSISIEALELLVHSAGIIVELASLRQRLAEVAPPYIPQSVVSSAPLPSPSYTSPYSTLTTPRPSFDAPAAADVTDVAAPERAVDVADTVETVAVEAEPVQESAPDVVEAVEPSEEAPVHTSEASPFEVVSEPSPVEDAAAEPVVENDQATTDELAPPESTVASDEPPPDASVEPVEKADEEAKIAEEPPGVSFFASSSEPAQQAADEPDRGFQFSAPPTEEPAEDLDTNPTEPVSAESPEPAPFSFASPEPEPLAPFSFEPQPWDTTQTAGSPIAATPEVPADEAPSEPPPFVFSPTADVNAAEPVVAEPAPFVFSTAEPVEVASSAPQPVNGQEEQPVQEVAEAASWTETRVDHRESLLTWETRAKPPFPGELTDEEEKLHSDARRFARLLVSEIKLYNEHQVVEGRSNNDLYERLKDDIDRSRQMYEKRVAAVVAERFDYFFDELLNTLALGDASKLGVECPGPTI
jgi:hypothetical protein